AAGAHHGPRRRLGGGQAGRAAAHRRRAARRLRGGAGGGAPPAPRPPPPRRLFAAAGGAAVPPPPQQHKAPHAPPRAPPPTPAAYEHFLRPPLAQHPHHAQPIFERAKVLAAQGDVNGAVNELRRFTNDPLRNSRPGPLAVVQLATFLRGQNKAADAVAVLAQ